MSVTITAIVLAGAIMHATWNALVKKSSNRLMELTTLNLAAGIVALALLPLVGLPGRASIPFLAVTLLFHIGYYVFLLLGYGRGGLSLVYPIARGTSPLLVAVSSALWFEESLTGLQLAGVLIIAGSIASLALSGGVRSLSSRAVVYSLLTGIMIAGYTVTDGLGARAVSSAPSYILAFFAIDALPLLIAVWVWHRRLPLASIRAHWRTGFLGGVLSLAAYGVSVWAMTRAPLALVSAVRETSVVFAAVIGSTLLGEPFGRHRILASMGVALGIIVLRAGA